MTNIEWTDNSWNPIVGCSKVSAGCSQCYAINQSYRNWAMAQSLPAEKRGRLAYYDCLTEKNENGGINWTGVVRFVEEALDVPLKRKKPTQYFVNSMFDPFHESVLDEWIDKIFAVMSLCQQHTFQILTKRPERMVEYFSNLEFRRYAIA